MEIYDFSFTHYYTIIAQATQHNGPCPCVATQPRVCDSQLVRSVKALVLSLVGATVGLVLYFEHIIYAVQYR